MAELSAEVAVAGHICLDIIPTFRGSPGAVGRDRQVAGGRAVAPSELLLPGKLVDVGPLTTATGGAVSNTGLALHRLGFLVRLMGKVGDDVVGRAILNALRQHGGRLADGVIITGDSHSSYTVVLSPPGVDRIFLHSPGANDTFGADGVDYAMLAGARLFHFGYPPLMRRMYADGGEELRTLLARVKQLGLTTSLDMARPDPASEAGKADWRGILTKALPFVDIFLPSFDETLYMLDRQQFEELERTGESGDLNARADAARLRSLADELIAMGVAIVGLKLGSQGMHLRTTDDERRLAGAGKCAPKQAADWAGRELLAPCFAVAVVGTTGSGDCTVAGFLGGLLKGLSPEEAMTAAVAVGAYNVEAADGASGIPPWSAVEARVSSGWERGEVAVALPGWSWDEGRGLWRSPEDGG